MEENLPNNKTTGQPDNLDVIIPDPVHPSKTAKLVNYVLLAFLAIAAVCIAIILRWSFASGNILKINNEPFPARITSNVVVLTVDVCKSSDVVGQTRTSFVSKTREIFLPLAEERLKAGCLKTDLPVIIPKDIPTDMYHIKFRVTYNVNPLKKGIVNEFVSKDFQVTAQ